MMWWDYLLLLLCRLLGEVSLNKLDGFNVQVQQG